MPLGVDLGRSKLGQTISGFLWVLSKEFVAEDSSFSEYRRQGFL